MSCKAWKHSTSQRQDANKGNGSCGASGKECTQCSRQGVQKEKVEQEDAEKKKEVLVLAYACLSPATMSNSGSSSHAQWQGTTRWKQGWNDAWKGWDDSAIAAPCTSEPIPDKRVTNALHMMQDHLQQTMVISQRRSPSKPHQRQKSNAAHEAMEAATQARERQEEARLAYVQKCPDATEAETIFSEAIKNSLAKTEALEKHVKTVTMRAEPLAATEADFFKNSPRPSTGNAEALERALCPAMPETIHTGRTKKDEVRGRILFQQCQESPKSGGGHASSMSSAQRVLNRAAHPMQRRPDGTKLSRHVWPRHSRPVGNRDVSVRTKGSRRWGVDPTRERESHRCHRSGCRSVGRPCFVGHSRDVRDAGSSPVGRKNERVRSRMTGQSMVDAVTSDHSTDSHLGLLFS